MFDGLAPVPLAGEDGACGLDERSPWWLAVALSGEARRTCLKGVRGNEQLREYRERPTQPLDLPLATATEVRVRQHTHPAADRIATSVSHRKPPPEGHSDGPGAQRTRLEGRVDGPTVVGSRSLGVDLGNRIQLCVGKP